MSKHGYLADMGNVERLAQCSFHYYRVVMWET